MAATSKTTTKTTKRTAKTGKTTAAKASAAEKAATGKKKSPAGANGAETPAMDRRSAGDRRKSTDRRKKGEPVAVERRKVQRRVKVSRRRQIDPTTCERDYTSDEIEFMSALDEYKRQNGRMFPTCSEVLEVLKKLGYEKRPATAAIETPESDAPAEPAPEATAV